MKLGASFLQSTRLLDQMCERVRCCTISSKSIKITLLNYFFNSINHFRTNKSDRPRQTRGSPLTDHGHGKAAGTGTADGEH